MISIVVPCYNQAQYIDECLDSVLNQTYENWECIIVNDGSEDNIDEVIQKWLVRDSRFKYIKKKNGGGSPSCARNAGIEQAKGEWILPLDADDKIGHRYLELAEKEFLKGYCIIYCRAEFFGEREGVWNLPEFSREKMASANIIFCSAFFKKTAWENIGGYDINMIYGLEDWEFWLSVLANDDSDVYRIDEILFFYRIKKKSRNVTVLNDLEKKRKMLKYIEKKHWSFFSKHLEIPYHELIEKYDLLQFIKK